METRAETEKNFERREHRAEVQIEIIVCTGPIHHHVCMWIMAYNNGTTKEDRSSRMLPKNTWVTMKTFDHSEEEEADILWAYY